MKIGYACINMSKPDLKVNRGLIRKTFDAKGLPYVSELIQKNLDDCFSILKWNVANNILSYRFSSAMFPWMTQYNIEDLPQFDQISAKLCAIGHYAKQHNLRVGFHPDHFCVLASENPDVVTKTVDELNFHGKVLDLMGLARTPYYGINIHINTSKPNKKDDLMFLDYSALSRLTVENDDRASGFTIIDLLEECWFKQDIPIVFDNLHWSLNHQDHFTFEMDLHNALQTWANIKPLIHWSSSKKIHEDSTARPNAHGDYIYEKIPDGNFDVEIEAKQKDLAVLKYLIDFA